MAIPHGKSRAVKEAPFAVEVMKTPISDWKSIVPENEVRIVIAANLINGGFLCGMLGGLVAGYSIRFLRKTIPAKGVMVKYERLHKK